MAYIDKAALFVPNLEEDDVNIDGGSVRVRALSRFHAGQVQERTETDARDRLSIVHGVINPVLSESEAGEWMKAAKAGDIIAVVTRIAQLSGLMEYSPKATFPDVPGKPVPGV